MEAGTISIISTISFVVILLLGFLIGFWRGLKRSTLNLVLSVVAAIVAFFCARPVTSAILGINTGNGTLNAQIVDALKGIPDVGRLVSSTPALASLIEMLPFALCCVLVFLVLSIAVQLVMYIIYKIFAVIFIKKKDKEGNKLPRHRLTGGIVGVVKVFILMLFIAMPMASLVGTVDDVARGNNLYGSGEGQASRVTAQVGDAMKGVNSSAFGVLGNFFGLDDAMFDYLSEFEVEGQKVCIRQEIADYTEVASSIGQITVVFNGNNNKQLSKLDFDKLDKTVDKMLDGWLYKSVVSEALGNIIVDYENYSFIPKSEEFSTIFAGVKTGLTAEGVTASDYFGNDIRSLYNAFKTLAKSGALDEKTSKDILAALGGEKSEQTKAALVQVFNMNILRDTTAPLVDLGLSKVMSGLDKIEVNGRELTDEDWDSLASSVVNIVDAFADLEGADLMGVLSDPMTLLDDDASITTTLSALGKLVDEVRGVNILKNSEGKPVIDSLLASKDLGLPTEQVKNAKGEMVTLDTYQKYFEFVAEPMEELKTTGVYPLLQEEPVSSTKVFVKFADAVAADKTKLNKIILPLLEVEPTKTLIKDMLGSVGGEFINFGALTTVADYEYDLEHISNILVALNKQASSGKKYLEILLDGTTTDLVKAMDASLVDELIPSILYAKSTCAVKDNLFKVYSETVGDILGSSVSYNYNSAIFNPSSSENQAMEVANVFKEFVAFYSNYEVGKTELASLDAVQMGRFLDALQKNAYRTVLAGKHDAGVFANGFDSLVDKIATAFGVTGLSGQDYSKVDFIDLFSKLNSNQGE